MEKKHCEIHVSIPKDADVTALEKAIAEALKEKLTASFLECKEITIILGRHTKPDIPKS